MRRDNKTKGVTLVELVTAIVILALISIPMGLMIVEQIQGMMSSTDYTAAGNLARQQMEILLNTAYASVASGGATVNTYAVNWTVTTVTGSNGAERKDITLTAGRTATSGVVVTLYGSLAKGVTFAP